MNFENFIEQFRIPIILFFVAVLHVFILLFLRFNLTSAEPIEQESFEILKLVDIEEFVPPIIEDEIHIAEDSVIVDIQPTISDTIIETEKKVIEVAHGPELLPIVEEPDYIPQHKISEIPEIPTQTILSKIQYPPLALRQGIEAVVYLELFIDQQGKIRKIEVLKDPGFGFAQAAIDAFTDIQCKPAKANSKPVAVRFRYPVRFSIK